MNFGDIYHDKKAQKRALLYLIGLLICIFIIFLISEYNKAKSENVLENGKTTQGVVIDCFSTNKGRLIMIVVEYKVGGEINKIKNRVEGYLNSKNLCLEKGSIVIVKYLEENPSEGEVDFNENIKLPDGSYFNSIDMQRRIDENE